MTKYRQLKIFFRILGLCSLLSVLCPVLPGSPEAAQPVNKKFVYYIYWSGIRAGKAVLEYKSTSEGTTISTQVTSAALISLFYKVNDFAQSAIEPDGYPGSFILKVREGFHRRNKATYFESKSIGRPQKVIFHNILDGERVEYYLDKPAYDPLSAFYAMTKMPLEVGRSEYIDIFDNKKLWKTEVQVLRRERVRVLAGEFDTIVIRPILKSEGIFLKTGDIYIWVTDDDRRFPVLLKSKVRVGHFTAVLAEGDY
ncbi:MAG TPA: DUF3108 domain-containing protein [Nitrospirae bacterium]|nr:hypothetical protein BMS3Abin06_02448 [bacterium BMS3Abin06]HDH10856.1 DUF3108 domain-containing protein [Nitrospirota bacterium]HDZ02279.1 DUF3108 domain-containing protein [Nitrospirota bacterium]